MFRPAAVFIAIACAGGSAAAQDTTAVQYACERGAVLPVVFVNSADPALAVAMIEGQLIALRQVPSGSGFFYADTDEQRGYRLRGQGDAVQLGWLAADHTAEEQVILAACTAQATRSTQD